VSTGPWQGLDATKSADREPIRGVWDGARSGGPASRGHSPRWRVRGTLPPEAECLLYFACRKEAAILGNVTKGRLRGGGGDGVADVVEAGLSQSSVAAVVSFDSTELTPTRTDSLNRIFFRKRSITQTSLGNQLMATLLT